MSWLKAKDWATGMEYSSLFHSGLRAIARRPRARRAREHASSSSPQEQSSSGGTTPLSSRLLRQSTTRSRHPSPASTYTDPSGTPPLRAPRAKRPRPSSTGMFVQPTKEVASVWSGGNSFEISEYPKFPEEERHRAGSRSFFVNLREIDAMVVSPIGEEPSLLLSSDPGVLLHHPTPRRERPTSISLRTGETRKERDNAWMLEESSPELEAHELEDELDGLHDEQAQADWRQFHIDWLRAIR